jgi:hypothetical protein
VIFREEKGLKVISVVSKDVVFFHRGTSGSNLLRSGGESISPVSSVAAGAKARRLPGV